MEFVYLLLCGDEWEDMTIYVSKEKAIQASKDYPYFRVEIFKQIENGGYIPTYTYYLNGELQGK